VPPEGRARNGIIGESPTMAEILRIIERVADTPTTVLVTGESGTGKELDRHARSTRLESTRQARSSRSTAPPSPRT
jgi:two-component system response regulator AtoC